MSKYRVEVRETTVYELDAKDEAEAYDKVHGWDHGIDSFDIKKVCVDTYTEDIYLAEGDKDELND